MWKNYFYNIQKKYSMRISTKEPLIIRLDGKNVTRNKDIDLIGNKNNKFVYAMEKTVKYFTKKYKCYAIYGSDEVSFIYTEPQIIIDDMSTEKSQHTNEIISVFSQQFFHYFNNFDKSKLIFWHAKCFSIPEEKIISYIKCRSRMIENVMVTYFLKSKNRNNPKMKLDDKIELCKQLKEYVQLEKCQKGILYYNGEQLDLNAFFNGEQKFVVKQDIEAMFSDFE